MRGRGGVGDLPERVEGQIPDRPLRPSVRTASAHASQRRWQPPAAADRSRSPAPVAGAPAPRGGLLHRAFREVEELQAQADYAQQLSRGIAQFNQMSTQVDLQRDALDVHHLPLRRKLLALQAQVHEQGQQTASDLRRLQRMRAGIEDEAARLGTLQHSITGERWSTSSHQLDAAWAVHRR
jgi:hypothetical protein